MALGVICQEAPQAMTQADTTNWLTFLAGLPIVVDSSTEVRAWSDTIGLARQHALSAYDAAHLELALRAGAPLATLDAQLDTVA